MEIYRYILHGKDIPERLRKENPGFEKIKDENGWTPSIFWI